MEPLHPEQLKRIRAMTPAERVAVSIHLYHTAREVKSAMLRKLHPEFSEAQVKQLVKEAFLYARD